MGKVKVKVVGDEQQEQVQLEEQKKRREAKSAPGGKKAQVKGVNLGGGERINSVGVTEEDIARDLETKSEEKADKNPPAGGETKKEKKSRKAEARIRSK